MSVIESIVERLRKYPQVKYETTDYSVVVFPTSDDGFKASLYVNGPDSYKSYNVFFDGWHQAFSSELEALECFACGLSSECRLKEYSRQGEPYKWTVEWRRDGKWERDSSSMNLVFLLFWERKEIKYLQNELVI